MTSLFYMSDVYPGFRPASFWMRTFPDTCRWLEEYQVTAALLQMRVRPETVPARVRPCNPGRPGYYWSQPKAQFVPRYGTTWTLFQWARSFRNDNERPWEFFGEIIPLWDESSPTYSGK